MEYQEYPRSVPQKTLREGSFDEVLPDELKIVDYITPIDEVAMKDSAGKSVRTVTMRKGCYDFRSYPGGELVLKGTDNEENIKNEIAFLQELGRIKHDNINMTYTGFTIRSRYFTISEKAHKDLKEVLFNSIPDKRQRAIEALFKHMMGLADALRTIHSASKAVVHYDIKPGNILVFLDPSKRIIDRMAFTDWGSSWVSMSGQQTDKIERPHRSRDAGYMPPNIKDSDKVYGKTLMKSDVWSLGCVYLEILVWLTKDSARLAQFRKARVDQSGNKSAIFYDPTSTTRLKCVQGELTDLKNYTLLDMKGLVRVIENMMTSNENSRITSEDVCARLPEAMDNVFFRTVA